jgi:hypothetical protein
MSHSQIREQNLNMTDDKNACDNVQKFRDMGMTSAQVLAGV